VTIWQQEVAGMTVGDIDDVATVAETFNVATQNDF
jgi:hypothetical protein